MVDSSKYWEMWRIDSVQKGKPVPKAKTFFKSQFPQFVGEQPVGKQLSEEQNQHLQTRLLSMFWGEDASIDVLSCALAGLCLRCYLSYEIWDALKKFVGDFGYKYHFGNEDILPLILNDDGKTLIILDRENNTPLVLDSEGNQRESVYKFFVIEVLRTFKPGSRSQNFNNWVYLKIRQDQELKDFLLSQHGFWLGSKWGLLNKAKPEHLQGCDRILLEVFHAVYRRDRRQQPKKARRCPDPSTAQLQEMLRLLQAQDVIIDSPKQLQRQLEKIAAERRHLQATGEEISEYVPDGRVANDPEECEEWELKGFVQQQSIAALNWGIEQGIKDRLVYLQQSKRRAAVAPKLIPGLRLLYCQGLSQSQITQELEMSNQAQVSRLLNPKELVTQIRFRTLDKLLNTLLEKARELGLTNIPPESDYLSNLVRQLEAFVDKNFFEEAQTEIQTGRNRKLNSIYAQCLRRYLEQQVDL